MPTDYIVRLKCPYGDKDQLLTLENREESLDQILGAAWNFECPVHGVQREIPLEGRQQNLGPIAGSQKPEAKSVSKSVSQRRSGKRMSVHVPILVYGNSNQENSFHEETSTFLVNPNGALMPLGSRVALGDTIFIKNKVTQQEQECLVAYVDTDVYGKLRVGAAFKNPAPHFWGVNRREYRISRKIKVKVRGLDPSGNSFVQSTYAVDISQHGARLEGIGYLTRPGETLQVNRRFQTAKFRVVWVGDIGTLEAGHAGLLNLEPNKNIWGVTFA